MGRSILKRSKKPNLRSQALLKAGPVFSIVGITFLTLAVILYTTLHRFSVKAVGLAKFEPPNGKVYVGVSTDHNVSSGGSDRLATFDQAAGITQPAIFNEYTTPDGSFSKILADATQGPTMIPMISWNLPFDNSQITNGSQDANISARIGEAKAFNKPIFVRPDWEFNGSWYPHWNNPAVTPSQYISSWQYVVNKFNAAGVTNVAFVWTPNVLDYFDTSGTRFPTTLWYPGDGYVDWIGLDSYPQSNTQDTLLNGQDGMNQMAGFAAAHNKPLALTEWALNTPHPDDPTVVDWVFAWQNSYPNTVKANMWFDFVTQGKDFTLVGHPNAAAEFRTLVDNNAEYLYSLADSNTPITGDVNGDGVVNSVDLSILDSHFGQTGTASQGDLNGDGVVNITDLSILASHWGL